MTEAELLRRITRLGRAGGVAVRYDPHHGKGSHGTLYYGARRTILNDPRRKWSWTAAQDAR